MSILCIAHIIKIISKKKSQRKETTLNYPSTFPTAFRIHTPCQLGRAFHVPGSDPRCLTPDRHNSLQLLTPLLSLSLAHTYCPPILSPPPHRDSTQLPKVFPGSAGQAELPATAPMTLRAQPPSRPLFPLWQLLLGPTGQGHTCLTHFQFSRASQGIWNSVGICLMELN